ncbi:MAG: penicillin-binding protein 2 [Gammaproteobacteria bacterium]|nr:MAG: penicillin-binding protein 2 [Gammaproteobacteria bacterium]
MLLAEKKQSIQYTDDFSGRRKLVILLMIGAMLLLITKAVQLQVLDTQFLQKEARSRHVGTVKIAAYRGQIKDRNGESLAVSAPVGSVWVNPQYCRMNTGRKAKQACAELNNETKLKQLAKLLGIPLARVKKAFDPATKRQFVYLKRRVEPYLAGQVKALGLPGVAVVREFKRFYPAGEVTAHLLGFTNVDDQGQEGLELMYNSTLEGVAGSKRVIRDGARRVIEEHDVESIKEPEAGEDLTLSIDERLQYLAYRELKAGVIKNKAKAGSLVILEAETGNVLAVVNQPSFNPNSRKGSKISHYRNRAITDVFEPGSTMKPLVVAAALEGGYVKEQQMFTTKNLRIKGKWVKDGHDYGTLNLTNVLKKSSNVAASKIALSMPPEYFWRFYHSLGFGSSTGVGFPGEASGSLPEYYGWSAFEQATLSFGYRISMSVLQLARSYTALADDGVLHSVSLLKRDQDEYASRVLSAETAIKVRTMIEQVVKKDGTAYKARVEGYRVAGKTGTVKKAGVGGYGKDYLSVFVGMAPASDPKLIIAVMVDSPQAGQYYGGLVAAPIFSSVMGGALRVLGIAPDEEQSMSVLLTKK